MDVMKFNLIWQVFYFKFISSSFLIIQMFFFENLVEKFDEP